MQTRDNARKNFVFQFLYQIVVLVVPLVVSPYLTRVLGDTALGTYSYRHSIAYYFVIFAMLGIAKHGQRIISSRRDDEIILRKTFWSLCILHFVCSILALITYFVYAFWWVHEDRTVVLILALYVFSAFFDITWLFQGLEDFKSVVIRNLLIKLFEVTGIFLFVHSEADLALYTLIMSLSALLGQMSVLPYAVKTLKPIRVSFEDVKEHMKPMLTLFIVVVAVTLYTVFDKTLLGLLASKEEVAHYEYSNKIINIPKTFIGVIGTVLFPRTCRLASKNDFAGMRRFMDYALLITCFIAFGSIFGLLAVGDLFARVYYGEVFEVCGGIIKAMCPLILIIGWGDIVRTQYLYPLQKDKTMVVIICCNAVINLIISFLLIPYLGVYGAVIGTTSAELFGLIIELIICRDVFSMKHFLRYAGPFSCIGFAMFFLIHWISEAMPKTISALLLQIVIAFCFYSTLSVIYLAFCTDIFRDIFKKGKKSSRNN